MIESIFGGWNGVVKEAISMSEKGRRIRRVTVFDPDRAARVVHHALCEMKKEKKDKINAQSEMRVTILRGWGQSSEPAKTRFATQTRSPRTTGKKRNLSTV